MDKREEDIRILKLLLFYRHDAVINTDDSMNYELDYNIAVLKDRLGIIKLHEVI